MGFFVPLKNFSLIWRRPHDRWRAANFDLCSALLAIQQWGFFSVLHILLEEASVYNVISEDPLTPVSKSTLVDTGFWSLKRENVEELTWLALIQLLRYLYITRNTVISPHTFTRITLHNSAQKCIWRYDVSDVICSFFDEKIPILNHFS